MSKKRYLNCKYLDAGMDGMLCSMSLCTTCKEFNGEKCSYYMPKNKSKDKEKQIEEMAKDIVKMAGLDVYGKATYLFEQGYRKLPKDSVVLTREEFDKLGLVVETVQEYESDQKGQPILVKERKIVKKLRTDFTELLNQEIRELQLAQERKETAEKILINVKSAFAYYDNEDMFSKKSILECVEEFAKQFGVEVKNG